MMMMSQSISMIMVIVMMLISMIMIIVMVMMFISMIMIIVMMHGHDVHIDDGDYDYIEVNVMMIFSLIEFV